ncbi:hypothetical protein SCLCIDRAFT_292014 [Scleroderma citrinum Foug A]|uniref:Uncharacterized protein n=1 Tax=Scleroderma citrinum Foug A TaxID=1036808 RepID=A0A0C3ANT4_9AGAM|nr:hypothetical protein SCLCIDRAFT_292014 [Scleroderma citrinum Foug A]
MAGRGRACAHCCRLSQTGGHGMRVDCRGVNKKGQNIVYTGRSRTSDANNSQPDMISSGTTQRPKSQILYIFCLDRTTPWQPCVRFCNTCTVYSQVPNV